MFPQQTKLILREKLSDLRPFAKNINNLKICKFDGTECSETSAYKLQTPGNYPKESIQLTYNYFLWHFSAVHPIVLDALYSSYQGHCTQYSGHCSDIYHVFTNCLFTYCVQLDIYSGYCTLSTSVILAWSALLVPFLRSVRHLAPAQQIHFYYTESLLNSLL